jgi:hypothetical protein
VQVCVLEKTGREGDRAEQDSRGGTGESGARGRSSLLCSCLFPLHHLPLLADSTRNLSVRSEMSAEINLANPP